MLCSCSVLRCKQLRSARLTCLAVRRCSRACVKRCPGPQAKRSVCRQRNASEEPGPFEHGLTSRSSRRSETSRTSAPCLSACTRRSLPVQRTSVTYSCIKATYHSHLLHAHLMRTSVTYSCIRATGHSHLLHAHLVHTSVTYSCITATRQPHLLHAHLVRASATYSCITATCHSHLLHAHLVRTLENSFSRRNEFTRAVLHIWKHSPHDFVD